MPLKIVRNDITEMQCDAIVNTANDQPMVGPGCDTAVYMAAGYEQLLDYRKKYIGKAQEGSAFITPGFKLPARYIIHAVSPFFIDGKSGEEEKLRSCYRKSLDLAFEHRVESIAFPLISTGSFGYPKEEGLRIAVDEINAFLLKHPMLVYIVVFDDKAVKLGKNIFQDLESYIDENYVSEKYIQEYEPEYDGEYKEEFFASRTENRVDRNEAYHSIRTYGNTTPRIAKAAVNPEETPDCCEESALYVEDEDFYEKHEPAIEERIKHLSDTFSQYLLYLIKERGMKNAEVYKNSIVDKRTFSKIKNNPDYHPDKMTAMCLCIGARLNMDQTRDLLARAGYALSPCDKTDVIFSYFIEHEIYSMIDLDIQLEEHGQKCLIP